MQVGIKNAFVLENIFGTTEVFNGAEIYNIVWFLRSDRIELSIIPQCEPVNPPEKWNEREEWDGVNIVLDLFILREIDMNITENKLYIDSCLMRQENGINIFECRVNNNKYIKFKYVEARIQFIKPIIREEL